MASLLFLLVCAIAVGFFLFAFIHLIAEEKRNHRSKGGGRSVDAGAARVVRVAVRNFHVIPRQAKTRKRERAHAQVHVVR